MEMANWLLAGAAWVLVFGYEVGAYSYHTSALLILVLITMLLGSIDSRVNRHGTTE